MTNIDLIIKAQQEELNAYYIYDKFAKDVKNLEQKKIIEKLASDELVHYETLKKITNVELKSNKYIIYFYYFILKFFGMTFGIRLLENDEKAASLNYKKLMEKFPEHSQELYRIKKDEEEHEDNLVDLLNEDRLNYMGSIVLGLNDALVELTGALAGYTFAFQNTKIIALTGLITGVSASFSMAASEYLAKSHEKSKNAFTSSIYTGVAYIITVILLIIPFLVFDEHYFALASSLFIAVFIIFIFNFYISIAKKYNFRKRFTEMALISLGVSAITFSIGVVIKNFMGLDI